ncbi:hypothetical protein K2173_006710 [Erythroxylum novogranatense]|uniref:Uncharacterized protein n=1 Tax=Erythroxylum novogranatense TaxID=1862640 RepID=A0AAV8TEY3_9ROSI|nr:hypothetical protein K2173_006710 [Erythroxylum novogranatense]
MAHAKLVSFVLIITLLLYVGSLTHCSLWIFWYSDYGYADGRCCAEHWELGSCIPGVDDDPETNGKCWKFCIEGCTKGGFCKGTSDNKHHCHCYC